MDEKKNLHFKIGELAEARTFEHGFRGAWFRCKIKEISKRKGNIGHVSEYYDFPDEKLQWTKLYQMTPYPVGPTRKEKIQLMLRPSYPPIYCKSQRPLLSEISEVTVIVDDAWKVGDLVDWWTTDCYWSGRILELLGDLKAMVELKPPPFGEGGTYKVLLKDVRPSLDWFPEHGWTVPPQDCPEHGWTVPPQGGKNSHACAQIIKPLNQEDRRTLEIQSKGSENRRTSEQPRVPRVNHGAGGGVVQTQHSEDRRMSEQPQVPHKNQGAGGGVVQIQSSEDRRMSEQPQVPHKDHGAGGGVVLDSMETDTLEAAIMNLEELVNKVKWIKKTLVHGVSFSDGVKPEWEFVDQSPASSAPK